MRKMSIAAGWLSVLLHASVGAAPAAPTRPADPCRQVCRVGADTVVHAAGTDLGFVGTRLTRKSTASIRALLADPGSRGETFHFQVKADRHLKGRLADRQAGERAVALERAFREAGLSADRLRVTRSR